MRQVERAIEPAVSCTDRSSNLQMTGPALRQVTVDGCGWPNAPQFNAKAGRMIPRDSNLTRLACILLVGSCCITVAGWLLPRAIAGGNANVAAESAADAAEKPSPEALEFFEKQVRPILANRCFECHSGSIEEPKGSLRLDSRAAILTGGDTGPAVEPGAPDKSMLIDAINYRGDYEMPPKSKMPAAEIEILTRWVQMGAPWPAGDKPAAANEAKKFDLAMRKAEHWAWQPVGPPVVPEVADRAWSRSAIDRFVLQRLEGAKLSPSAAADKPTLLRRIYFDLTGLPPTPAEVDAFVADSSPDAFERIVDRLLAAPAFGERWARHWLDLMRYAETRGHEFDFIIPNAYEYRDYTIRALNADVPYDAFVAEHVAGDLIAPPRLHPTTGGNESILGTGFWHLGEAVHSPVDIRKDETDRVDNAVDVLSKTFLAMTVSCARCHDHKFDAISTRDYYALAGYMQSAEYRLAPFDTMEHNHRVAEELWKLDAAYRPRLAKAFVAKVRPGVERTADYLLAAREVILAGPSGEAKPAADAVVFESFESGDYTGWTLSGNAFGQRPQTLKTIAPYQGKINAVGEWFVNSHNIRSGEDIHRGDEYTGTMTSREFKIEHDFVTFWIGGGAHSGRTCMNLLVDGKAVRSTPGRNNNQMSFDRWDVRELRGRTARIEVVDAETGGWGNIGVDEIVFTNRPETKDSQAATRPSASEVIAGYRDRAAEIAKRRSLPADAVLRWVVYLLATPELDGDVLSLWRATGLTADADDPELLQRRFHRWLKQQNIGQVKAGSFVGEGRVVLDYANAPAEHWLPDGPAFGPRAVRPGDMRLAGDASNPFVGVAWIAAAERDATFAGMKLSTGVENDPGRPDGTIRVNRTIRTPTFGIESGRVWALVRGAGAACAVVDSHRLNQGPLHGALAQQWEAAANGQAQWIAWDLSAYKNHRTHIEFSARESGEFAVLMVVDSATRPENLPLAGEALAAHFAGRTATVVTLDELAKRSQAVLLESLDKLENEQIAAAPDARAVAAAADWLVRNSALFDGNADADANFIAIAKEFSVAREKLTANIRRESHAAPAMLEGTPEDENLLIRGNSNTPGPLVPRAFLEAIAGADQKPIEHGSGRLQLAEQMTDRANPLAARVIVNRLWHHLMGRGIVASVDNFGVLGDQPTHPELLDYMATDIVDDGWSLKRQIRAIATSSAYRMSSRGDARADAADPTNRLWHRAERKRLSGEVIRDAMLAVSGRANGTMYGRSVNEHLTDFLEGRGRPASGPLDGDGRRSVYLSVRRNFLSPMMLAFDTPSPVSTTGRRNVSNVPAQALMLLNGPFVIEQARVWANRELAEKSAAPRDRVTRLYREAFARPATETEITDALAFLDAQGEALGIAADARANDPRLWADLCHVLFNVKEFVFVN